RRPGRRGLHRREHAHARFLGQSSPGILALVPHPSYSPGPCPVGDDRQARPRRGRKLSLAPREPDRVARLTSPPSAWPFDLPPTPLAPPVGASSPVRAYAFFASCPESCLW